MGEHGLGAWWMTAAVWAGGLVGVVGVPLLAWVLG